MYVYCTNTILDSVGKETIADIALDSENPTHTDIIAQYAIQVHADFGGVPSRVSIRKTESGYEASFLVDYELNQLKTYALQVNKGYIEKQRELGCPTSLGFPVSCQLQDIQNMSALVDVMVASFIEEVDFRDYSNEMHKVTVLQMRQILLDVYMYGIQQYQVKWIRDTQIQATTTYEELQQLWAGWGE